MADRTISTELVATDRMSPAFHSAAASASALHTRATAVGTALGTLAAHGVMKVTSGLGRMASAAGKSGITTAAGLEQARIGFDTLLGSSQRAGAYVTKLQKFAAATPFEFNGLVDSSRLLLGVGVSARKVIPTLTDFGDAAGALNIQQDAFQRIMLASSQAIAAGRFQVGDLNQLMNNGLPVWKLLSDATGKSTMKLRDMASKGKLLAKDVLPELRKEMHKDYGGAMSRQSQTLTGLWSTFQDTMHQGLASVFQPMVPILERSLPGAMTAMAAGFKIGAGASKAFFSAWSGAKLDPGGKFSGFASAGQKAAAVLRRLRANAVEFAHAWTGNVGPLGKQMGLQGDAVSRWAVRLHGWWRDLGRFGAGFRTAAGEIRAGNLSGTLGKIASAVHGLAPDLLALVPAGVELAKGFGTGLADSLDIAGVAVHFLADHAGLLAKGMPILVGGILAYKTAQIAANVASAASPIVKGFEIAANLKLASSNRALAASALEAAAASRASTAAAAQAAGASVASAAGSAASGASAGGTAAAAGANGALAASAEAAATADASLATAATAAATGNTEAAGAATAATAANTRLAASAGSVAAAEGEAAAAAGAAAAGSAEVATASTAAARANTAAAASAGAAAGRFGRAGTLLGAASKVAVRGFAALATLQVGKWIGGWIEQSKIATVSTKDLGRSLIDFGKTGRFTGASQDMFHPGFLTKLATNWSWFGKSVLSSKDAMKEFQAAARDASGKGISGWFNGHRELDKITRQQDPGLAGEVKSGNVDEARASYARLTAILQKNGRTAKQAAAAYPQYHQALVDVAAATGKTTDTVTSLDVVMAKNQATVDGLASKTLALRGDASGYQAAVDGITGALKANGKTLSLNTAAGRANNDAISNLVQTGLTYANTLLQAKGPAAYRAQLVKTRTALVKAAEGFGLSKKAADRLANSLVKIPKKTAVELQADVKGFDAKIAAAKGRLSSLSPKKRVALELKIDQWMAARNKAQARVDAMHGNTVGLKADIANLMSGVASSKARLRTVPKSQRTQLTANIGSLYAAVRSAKVALAQLRNKTVYVTVQQINRGYAGNSATGGKRDGGYLRGFADGGRLPGAVAVTTQAPVRPDGRPSPAKARIGRLARRAARAVQRLASGGPIAWVSGGEYLVSQEGTRRHRRLLEAINAGRDGFAAGGRITRRLRQVTARGVIRQAAAVVAGPGRARRMLRAGGLVPTWLGGPREDNVAVGPDAAGMFVINARQTRKHLALIQAIDSGTNGYADGGGPLRRVPSRSAHGAFPGRSATEATPPRRARRLAQIATRRPLRSTVVATAGNRSLTVSGRGAAAAARRAVAVLGGRIARAAGRSLARALAVPAAVPALAAASSTQRVSSRPARPGARPVTPLPVPAVPTPRTAALEPRLLGSPASMASSRMPRFRSGGFLGRAADPGPDRQPDGVQALADGGVVVDFTSESADSHASGGKSAKKHHTSVHHSVRYRLIHGDVGKALGSSMVRDILAATPSVGKATEKLAKTVESKLKAAIKARAEYIKSLKDSIISASSITSVAFADNGTISTTSLMNQMTQKLADAQMFQQRLKKLTKMGLNKTQLDQIAQAGPDQGSKIAGALVAGGKSAIDQANKLNAGIRKAAAGAAQAAGDGMYTGGVNAAKGMIAGLRAGRKQLLAVARSLGHDVAKEVRKALKIKSPSVVFDTIGRHVMAGWAGGLTAGHRRVVEPVARTARAVRAVAERTARPGRVPHVVPSQLRTPLLPSRNLPQRTLYARLTGLPAAFRAWTPTRRPAPATGPVRASAAVVMSAAVVRGITGPKQALTLTRALTPALARTARQAPPVRLTIGTIATGGPAAGSIRVTGRPQLGAVKLTAAVAGTRMTQRRATTISSGGGGDVHYHEHVHANVAHPLADANAISTAVLSALRRRSKGVGGTIPRDVLPTGR